MVQVSGSIEDERTFNNLAFMKSKLRNRLTTHLDLCVCMFTHNFYIVSKFPYDVVSPKERDPDNNQTPPRSTALLVTGLAFLTHTPAEHSQQLARTQTPLSLLQTQSLHRASKIEFHNSDSHKKSPPTQASNLLEHQTKA
jgi:zona occludens toxin (predicted ATPase)